MKAKYIIDAIVLLRKVDVLLQGGITPEQKGHLSAQAFIVANQLSIYSGIEDVVFKIEKDEE